MQGRDEGREAVSARGAHAFSPEHLLTMEERRRALLDPEAFLRTILPQDDHVLANLGCGVGFFALPAAQHLARGKVIAIDWAPEMLAVLVRRAKEQGLTNIEVLTADIAATPLPDRSVDHALLAQVFHDLDEREATLGEMRRILRPEGRLHLLEWHPRPSEFGPPLALRIPPEELVAVLEEGPFRVVDVDLSLGPFYRVTAVPRLADEEALP